MFNKSSSTNITDIKQDFTTDSYNRNYSSTLQALSGVSTSGEVSNTDFDIFGQSNTSGFTFGKASGSQVGLSSGESSRGTVGQVGGDFSYAESGANIGSTFINKSSGGSTAGSSTGGMSSTASISKWLLWAGLGVILFFIYKRSQ